MSDRTITHRSARAQWEVTSPALRASVVPFLVSRAIVLVALGAARLSSGIFKLGAAAHNASYSGLLGWDARWYDKIAAQRVMAAWRWYEVIGVQRVEVLDRHTLRYRLRAPYPTFPNWLVSVSPNMVDAKAIRAAATPDDRLPLCMPQPCPRARSNSKGFEARDRSPSTSVKADAK